MCKIKNVVKQYFRDISGLVYTPFLTDGMCELLKLAKEDSKELYEKVYNLVHSDKLQDKYKREHTIFVHLSDYINIEECTQDITEEILYNREELNTRDIKELKEDFVHDITVWCNEKVQEILTSQVLDFITNDSMTYTYEYCQILNIGSCYPNSHIEQVIEYGMKPTVENIAIEFLRYEYAQKIIDSFDYDIEQFSDYLKEELLKHYCKEYTPINAK